MLELLLLQVLASCLWLGHSEVVKPFELCPQFFYEGTIPNYVLYPENPAWICQRYSNQYRFATLYDKNRRIPVYSAYIYKPGSGERSKSWFLEPQLIRQNFPKEMQTEQFIMKKYKVTSAEMGKNQAINTDYKNLENRNRGHLCPSGHQTGNDDKTATFTLTNIVPQYSKLNQGAWSDYENQMMAQKTQGCDKTYVITGAVPGNAYISDGRVNVPSYIWSAACCLKGNKPLKAWGAIAENNKNEVQNLMLGKLEDMLSKIYNNKTVALFHIDCPRN